MNKIINKKNKNTKMNIKTKDKKNSNTNKSKKLSYKDFTITEIEQELKREKYLSRYKKVLMSTIYTLIIVASIAALIATLVMPVLQISGSSMNKTLYEGEIVLSIKTKKLKCGDIVAFYHGNKILIKRVIAGPNTWVNITDDGNVYVNDVLLEEPYVEKKYLGETNIEFPYQVPDESYFILGDKRETSVDSRNSTIGTIKYDDIIGKVIFRVWPLKKIGLIN